MELGCIYGQRNKACRRIKKSLLDKWRHSIDSNFGNIKVRVIQLCIAQSNIRIVILIATVHKLARFRHLDLTGIADNHDLIFTVGIYVTGGDLTYVYHSVDHVILLFLVIGDSRGMNGKGSDIYVIGQRA